MIFLFIVSFVTHKNIKGLSSCGLVTFISSHFCENFFRICFVCLFFTANLHIYIIFQYHILFQSDLKVAWNEVSMSLAQAGRMDCTCCVPQSEFWQLWRHISPALCLVHPGRPGWTGNLPAADGSVFWQRALQNNSSLGTVVKKIFKGGKQARFTKQVQWKL